MTTRRTFMSALAALPVAALPSPKPEVRRGVVFDRPKQVGINEVSYFEPDSFFHSQHSASRVYLDDIDISNWCFEVDLAGGWAGCFEHHFNDSGALSIGPPDGFWEQVEIVNGQRVKREMKMVRYWQFGKVEIR